MKKINIQCHDNGKATLKTNDTHVESENKASIIEVDFSQVEYKNYQKGIDIQSGSYLHRYFLGNDEVVFKELTYENTLPGELVITPFVFDEVNDRKVRYLTDCSVIIHKRRSIASHDFPDNVDLILEEIKKFLEETTGKLVVDMEFNKDTNLLSLILENGDKISEKISTIIDGGGNGSVDLSNYFNKTEINSMLDNKVDKNANITAGTHPKITYDEKGLVTGGEALVVEDIPNLNASKINAGTFDVERIPNLAPTKITQDASNRFVTDVEKAYWDGKQNKLVAGENITIDENTNVISASGGGGDGGKEFHRVRIFDSDHKLITTQILYEGEKVLPLDKPGYLFYFGTRNEVDYNTIITEDIDLTYSIIPPRYIQTTTSDFDASGDYTGTGEYIILPKDKPSGYKIVNPNVIGVATEGDYLTSAKDMFNGNNSLYLELDYLNTSKVTDMSYMFRNSKATTLDLSNFDTSNVSNMSYMFYGLRATTLDLSNFDTSNVTSMGSMFYTSQATALDLSSFNTSNVTSMSWMFYNSQATTLNLSSFDTSNVIYMGQMFQGSKATTLDLSSFDTSKVTDMTDMFRSSQATIGYARTQADADRFNSSSGKPSSLNFVVK